MRRCLGHHIRTYRRVLAGSLYAAIPFRSGTSADISFVQGFAGMTTTYTSKRKSLFKRGAKPGHSSFP